MTTELIYLGCVSFFIIAALYSSVGHAGASGYLAIMALLSFPSNEIKPVSLILNIVVALISSYRFLKEGFFDRKVFVLFSIFSIPMAFIGGYFKIDDKLFKILAGIFLIISALMIALKTTQKDKQTYTIQPVPIWKAGIIGSSIGYISGLIGVGGGIFLSPILMLFRWASPKNVSGISALFILVNSILGLLGHISSINQLPKNIFLWVISVIIGGLIGSYWGTKKINTTGIYIILAIVLISAGLKMILF